MAIHAIIAIAAGGLIVVMLAIAFGVPEINAGHTPKAERALARKPLRAPTWNGASQAWQLASGAHEHVRRFLVLLDSDWRNIRTFRSGHPDTDVLLFTCVVSVVVGALIVRL